MPLYDVECPRGHRETVFHHRSSDRDTCRHMCLRCGEMQAHVFTLGAKGLTHFSEKSPQVIWNMGPEPVEIRSPKQHQDEMARRKLRLLDPKYGEAGCWS